MRFIFFFVLLAGLSCQDNVTTQSSNLATPQEAVPAATTTTIDSFNTQQSQPGESLSEPSETTTTALTTKPVRSARPKQKLTAVRPNRVRTDSMPPESVVASVSTEKALAVEPPTSSSMPPDELPSDKPDHRQWTGLLFAHVNAGGDVDYASFKQDIDGVRNYLNYLSDNTPQKDWTRNEQMAYWINAYNAATILLVLENYPLSSIRKLDNGKTWDVKRIKLGDKKYSLNDIENDILRPKYKDARIHFAVNCAAKGCPPMNNMAFEPGLLDQQLDDRTRAFVRSKKYNNYAESGPQVSKIFEWYASDFGDLRKFLNKYLSQPIPSGATFGYKEYNWELNDR